MKTEFMPGADGKRFIVTDLNLDEALYLIQLLKKLEIEAIRRLDRKYGTLLAICEVEAFYSHGRTPPVPTCLTFTLVARPKALKSRYPEIYEALSQFFRTPLVSIPPLPTPERQAKHLHRMLAP